MAKTNNNLARWIVPIIAIGSIIVGLVGGWTTVNNKQETQAKEMVDLKTGGCDPARKHEIQIEVIQSNLDHISATQGEIKQTQDRMQRRQERDTQRIIEAIEKQ